MRRQLDGQLRCERRVVGLSAAGTAAHTCVYVPASPSYTRFDQPTSITSQRSEALSRMCGGGGGERRRTTGSGCSAPGSRWALDRTHASCIQPPCCRYVRETCSPGRLVLGSGRVSCACIGHSCATSRSPGCTRHPARAAAITARHIPSDGSTPASSYRVATAQSLMSPHASADHAA